MGSISPALKQNPAKAVLWRNGQFRWFLTGHAFRIMGGNVGWITLNTVAVIKLGAKPVEVGLLVGMNELSFSLLGPFGGLLVDRFSKREVMFVLSCVTAAIYGLLYLCLVSNSLRIEYLYAGAILLGATSTTYLTACQSLVPQIVSHDEGHANANAAILGINIFGSGVGAMISGAIIQSWSAGGALLTPFFMTFWASAFFTQILPASSGRQRTLSWYAEMKEGFSHLIAQPVLRNLLTYTPLAVVAVGVVQANLIVMLYRVLHLTPGIVGVLLAFNAIGGILGSVLATRHHTLVRGTQGILVSMALGTVAGLLYFASSVWKLPLIAGPAILLDSLWFTWWGVNMSTEIQKLTPPEYVGRSTSFMFSAAAAAVVVGSVSGGILGSWLGPGPAIGVGALLPGLACLLLLAAAPRSPSPSTA